MAKCLNDPGHHQSSIISILLMLCLLLAICLYSVHITSDLYGDEESTFRVVSQGNILENLWSPDLCHPPLFFLAAKACYMATGLAWSIRMPSVLAALATVLVVFRLAHYLFGKGVAIWALWLAVSSPLLVEFAAEGRPYAMLACFSTAGMYLLLRFMQEENWRSALYLALALAGGFLTHYIFVAHAAFMGMYYLVRKRRITKHCLGLVLLLSPVLLFLALGIMRNADYSARFGSLQPKHLSTIVTFLARLPIALSFGFCTFKLPELNFARHVGVGVIRENALSVGAAAFGLAGVTLMVVRCLLKRREWVITVSCSVVVPGILLLCGVLAGSFAAREKYLIGAVGTFLILVAVVFQGASRSLIRLSIATAYLSVVAISLFHYTVQPNIYSRRMDWGGVRTLLGTEMKTNDALLLYRFERAETRQISPNVEGILLVDLDSEIESGRKLRAIVRELSDVCQGRIFLVNNAVHQVYLDPGQKVLACLEEERTFERHSFGRNLSVYIFSP